MRDKGVPGSAIHPEQQLTLQVLRVGLQYW